MIAKIGKLIVQDVEISLTTINKEDYICITDMLKAKDGDFFISDWLRNANTLEYLAAWETMNNPNFNYGEFAIIRAKAGVHSYKISVKEWVQATGAIGIVAKTGRYGGTYAHKDIAFNFGMWISPVFQLYIVKEYQRLKEVEANQYGLEWNVNRILSKVNYKVQADAVKQYKIPQGHFTFDTEKFAYTEEADLLNLIMFQCTARQWREANPERAAKGENVRDTASINELTILSNLESYNATLIRKGIDKARRFTILSDEAQSQKKSLEDVDFMKSLKKHSDGVYVDAAKEIVGEQKHLKKKKLFGR